MNTLAPLRAIQIFETLGRCDGLVETARRLDISPGAVSQQIKLLENALGVKLVTKEGKRMRLSATGRRYHESCLAAFETLRIAQDDIERSKNVRSLNVSALPSLLSKWLAPRINAWQKAHPDISVYLDGSHSEPSPDAHEIDFRISYGDRIDDAGTSIELFRDSVVPVCSPRILPRKGKVALKPADLAAFELIAVDWLPKFASPPSWHDWFAANGVETITLHEPHQVHSLSSVAIQAAIDGHGFVLAQCSMVADDVTAGRLAMPVVSAIPLPWPYFLTWRESTFDRPQCRAFHRWLLARAREQQRSIDLLALRASET